MFFNHQVLPIGELLKTEIQETGYFIEVLKCLSQSYLTLWDPSSSVHGVLQARIQECVAISFSKGSSWPRHRTQVSCIAGRFFTVWDNRKVLELFIFSKKGKPGSQGSLFYYNYVNTVQWKAQFFLLWAMILLPSPSMECHIP